MRSSESGKNSSKNAVSEAPSVMASNFEVGMKRVTVKDLSWFGRAIIMNWPRGQMWR